jgi:hypothetical protein
MTKAAPQQSATPLKSVWNSNTGQFVTVRGAGTLKGQLKLRKSVDLTKPIAAQALKAPGSDIIRKG